MASLEAVLAQIPFYSGFRAARQANDEETLNQVRTASGVVGLQGAMQQQQAQQQAAAREQQFWAELEGLGPNASQDQLAQVAAKFSPASDVLKSQTASADRRALADDRRSQNEALLAQRAHEYTQTLFQKQEQLDQRREEFMARQQDAQARQQFEQWYRRETLANQQRQQELSAELRKMGFSLQREGLELRREVGSAPIAIQDPNSPTGYRYGTRQEALGRPAPGPFANNLGNYERAVSNDFERHPVVKDFVSLKPDVDVVQNYMTRRATVPVAQRAVYDKNLVNTFMRVTHPKGDQISNFERKDMGALPALPDRITRAIEGFFSGSYVPDDVAAEMANVVNEKFTAKQAQVADLENKMVEDVRRRGGNPAAIRRITRAADVRRINSDAEYNALPSGAEFIGPDGKKRKKP